MLKPCLYGLATNSIHVKKIRGGVPKPFWLGREDCFYEISSECYYLVLFNFGLYKWDQIFGFLACSNE